jgi:hypothetical protein
MTEFLILSFLIISTEWERNFIKEALQSHNIEDGRPKTDACLRRTEERAILASAQEFGGFIVFTVQLRIVINKEN